MTKLKTPTERGERGAAGFHEDLRIEIMEALARVYPPEDVEPDELRDEMGDAVMAIVWPRLKSKIEEIFKLDAQVKQLRKQQQGNLHVALALALGVPTMTLDAKMIEMVRALR
jgi:hypothetical protein